VGEITFELTAVPAADVRPLRERVLRPGQSPEQLSYPGDDDLLSLHVAATGAGAVLAVASVMPQGLPGDPRPGDWRIRGMASTPQVRGRGIGAAMLVRLQEHARSGGGRRIWCNARVRARTLYERAGMRVLSGPFEIPGIGEHYLMAGELARGEP
jgi:GNAT superfamily N-acetyltransferase